MIRPPQKLPNLQKLLPLFTRLDTSSSSSFGLYTELKKVILSLRGKNSVLFYSTREIAQFFKVSQRIVVRVYADLEAEGLVVRQRATGTWLQPLKKKPVASIQGVVGLPIWKWAYCHYYDWQYFVDQMQDQLRRHNFVGDFIPFYQFNDVNGSFQDRILSRRLDYLVWYKPLGLQREIIETLQDHGVNVAIISDGVHLPCRTYLIDDRPFIKKCFESWIKNGVTEVTLLTNITEKTTTSTLLEEPFRNLTIKHQTIALEPEDFPSYVASLESDRSKAVILPSSQFLNELCTLHGEDFRRLLSARRVALTQMILGNPEKFRGYSIDIITYDVQQLTERITSDISKGNLLNREEIVPIEPKLYLNADAAQFARAF